MFGFKKQPPIRTLVGEGTRLQGELRFADGLRTAGFTVYPTRGTYFIVTDVAPLGFDDGAAFCWRLPELIGVAAVPVSVFCADPDLGRTLVRFAFCKRDEVLTEAVSRLSALGS